MALPQSFGDGGTFTGVADIVSKYGLVPKDVMPETNSSENTSSMAGLIALKLREQGLQLRDLAAQVPSLLPLKNKNRDVEHHLPHVSVESRCSSY